MGTVVVLGSLMTDLVARAPRLPHAGESLIGDDFSTYLGSKGMNQAIAARRMGAEVTMIGRVGTDTFGDPFFPLLAQEGKDAMRRASAASAITVTRHGAIASIPIITEVETFLRNV